MGLGNLFNRSTRYDVTNTVTGEFGTFTVVDNLAPDWGYGAYRGGMSIPGAARAATLLADLIGSVPWHAYRQRAGNPVEQLPTPPLLDQPNPPEARVNTFSSWAYDLIWHGNAVGVIASRGPDGWPTGVTPVPAEQVQIRRVRDWGPGRIPVGEIEYSIGGRSFFSDEVVHIKGPCEPGALRGMGVLENHLTTLNLAAEQSRQARSLTQHGVPTGVLRSDNPDLTSVEADALKKAWLRSQRDRTVAVLNSSVSFEALSWNPEELQLLEARKFSLHELALIFGVPLSFLGAEQSSRTYSNVEQEALNLIKFSLTGHLSRFEQTLSLRLPRGTWVKANLDAILRADTATRYSAHATAIASGFLTVNEVRALEDLPPLPIGEANGSEEDQ